MLRAEDLTASYADFTALQGVTCRVEAGSTVALVGPNGAGKSTFMRLAAGLLDPSGGRVAVDGHPAGSLEARALLSYLPDAPALYDDLSLNEHLEYVARMHGVDAWQDRAGELLERLGLADRGDNPPGGFSRGMRQKASIALAFVRPFGVLLADEPFDGLDPPSREALDDLVAEAAQAGAAVVLATHRTEVLDRADRCLAIDDGRLLYDGPAGEWSIGDDA
ncbi:MAG: ABC transporter ATP-binding protein [Acidimicrobiales bacterium]